MTNEEAKNIYYGKEYDLTGCIINNTLYIHYLIGE